jgi:hypothetical protein
MDRVCLWDDSEATRIVHNKKALGAALFISFIGYTGAVALGELKRGTRVRPIFYDKS